MLTFAGLERDYRNGLMKWGGLFRRPLRVKLNMLENWNLTKLQQVPKCYTVVKMGRTLELRESIA